MGKDLVTETPFELFDKAESDVLIINSHIIILHGYGTVPIRPLSSMNLLRL